jgi:hypothetical protein
MKTQLVVVMVWAVAWQRVRVGVTLKDDPVIGCKGLEHSSDLFKLLKCRVSKLTAVNEESDIWGDADLTIGG